MPALKAKHHVPGVAIDGIENRGIAGDRQYGVRRSGSNDTDFRSDCEFDPERGSGIVIMTNGAGGAGAWREIIAATSDP